MSFSQVAQPKHLAISPYNQFFAFLSSLCHLVTESTGCGPQTGLAFSKSKMAAKMAAKNLEMA